MHSKMYKKMSSCLEENFAIAMVYVEPWCNFLRCKLISELKLFLYSWNWFSLKWLFPLWARGPQRLGWGAELTHTATGEW